MNYRLFAKELAFIKDESLRKKVEEILTDIPECMEHKTSSSSGKYHPQFDCTDGGNVKHTRAVVRVLTDILNMYNSYDVYCINTDNLYAAAILHDICKYGENPDEATFTVSNHPVLAGNLIRPYYPEVAQLIESHMGRWNEIRNEEREVIGYLPVPTNHEQWLLHFADYIASRKYISERIFED